MIRSVCFHTITEEPGNGIYINELFQPKGRMPDGEGNLDDKAWLAALETLAFLMLVCFPNTTTLLVIAKLSTEFCELETRVSF